MLWWAALLQLWLWSGGEPRRFSQKFDDSPLANALVDADTLLQRFGRRDTIELQISAASPTIRIEKVDSRTALYAPDSLSAVAGVYALLEEKHGITFVHPKHTIQTPFLRQWKQLEISPRFHYRGFHLHTQHPIELTEALHDPDFPQAEQLVREYIDWLTRNRQNYFEFCLLRTVDLERWIPYFRRLVSYAKARGIEVGIDLSLRMQQQYAFQLMPRWQKKGPSLRYYLKAIASTGISRLNVELTAAEFVGKSWGSWKDSLTAYGEALGLRLMTRQHVVPPEKYAVGKFHAEELPPSLTLCVHSVMCYGLRDTLVPVYRCKDFSHLYRTILAERGKRSVWYYPETAYWVTFDNSVPVWLLSYLRSRLEDILTVEGLVEGHLTFSSGWDVGYWLFDWSVARWSWRYKYDGVEVSPFAAEGLVRLFGGDTASWQRLIFFQDSVLVGRNGLSYITPTTPIDEISWNRLPGFQPRLPTPPWRLYYSPKRHRSLIEPVLEGFRHALSSWLSWPELPQGEGERGLLFSELRAAWELTRLRVAFRYHWLAALVSPPASKSERVHIDSLYRLLSEAERWVSQLPVRYPHTVQKRICRPARCRHPHPAYRFGYLYPAVSLHFWQREIGQVEEGKWSVWYKNLWNIPRIIGLW
ncbi:MAG: hypothetical protein N2253_06235 [Bacteroidia bacterium]|nr:hypothetical protein [Bacteroidia bacterium]